MGGIFGYIKNDNEFTEEFIKKQFEKGKSRGPESSKIIKFNNLFLGFHRLAINGLNQESNQPMCIDNIYLICNGEIYNYRNFKDISFATKSDCEIIIHLYHRLLIPKISEI